MENKINLKNIILHAMLTVTSVLPLTLSMSFFLGFNSIICIILTCIACIFAARSKDSKIMPVYITFLIILYCISKNGFATSALACIFGSFLLLISNLLVKKYDFKSNPAVSGAMLATALSTTVLITTHYFGIGAEGNTVREMLSSYLSLGFHPNWRGILFGTIVMVVMITFPRKFKKLDKIISAPFIAIIITLILNLFLNPADMISAISEVGDKFFTNELVGNIPFILNGKINVSDGIFCGLALFFILFYACDTKDTASSAVNLLTGGCLSAVMPYGIKLNKLSVISGIIASLISTVLFVFGDSLIQKIPVSSLAVIIIVGAWGSVRWGEIKKAFVSPAAAVLFVIPALSCLMFGIVYGIIISAVTALVSSKILKIRD